MVAVGRSGRHSAASLLPGSVLDRDCNDRRLRPVQHHYPTVEYNASARAMNWLTGARILQGEQVAQAREPLSWAHGPIWLPHFRLSQL